MNIIRKKSSTGTEKKRLRLTLVMGFMAALLLLSRFFYVQIIHNRDYASLGDSQSIREASLYPKRGQISDRNGVVLAVNAEVDKDNLKQLGMMVNEQTGFVLKRPIKRMYPERYLAGQLIGFVGRDGYGLSGVEYGYDRILYGEAGWSLARYDAKSRRVFELDLPVKSSVEGRSVQLTLSTPIQAIAEECLHAGAVKCGAGSGAVIVMDPFTGDVLAMASYPFFDPNGFSRSQAGALRNNALGFNYEPGSTFKIIAAAAALEEGVFKESDIIETGQGELKVFDQIIHDTHKNGAITFKQAMALSSNIAFAKIATALGPERFFRYVKNFGFGQKTGIEVPGEEPGLFKPLSRWSGRTLMTMAMGQEISVTLLQMATAYCAIANGGVLMAPRMVSGLFEGEQCVERVDVRPIRRLMSPRTARRLTDCLASVVEADEGTGVSARVEGLTIAGKTGTAQKIDPVTKLYQKDKYVASFAGYFPAESPQLLCIVMLDEPKTLFYGGLTAAPVFKDIVTRLLHSQVLPYGARILGRTQTVVAAAPEQTLVPALCGLSRDTIVARCEKLGLRLSLAGTGDCARTQSIKPGKRVEVGTALVVDMGEPASASRSPLRMPQVVGLPLRTAVEKLVVRGMKIQVKGSGTVVRQAPEGGQWLKKDDVCVLEAG